MKNAAVLVVSVCLAGVLSGCGDLASPFTMTLNLPAEYCFPVGTSNDTEWSGEEPVRTMDLVDDIDSDLRDNIEASRVTDILVMVAGPYPSAEGAQVSGKAEYRLDSSGTWAKLAEFNNVRYSDLAAGVSLLHPDPALVTFDQGGVGALILALTSATGLPDLVLTVRASGTTTPVTEPGVKICYQVIMQTDLEFSP